uniref:Uncharacterized protein n=1 Tax=Oryza punctata TaxID=4537 RepID=A0A0E0MH27_ORYPU
MTLKAQCRKINMGRRICSFLVRSGHRRDTAHVSSRRRRRRWCLPSPPPAHARERHPSTVHAGAAATSPRIHLLPQGGIPFSHLSSSGSTQPSAGGRPRQAEHHGSSGGPRLTSYLD